MVHADERMRNARDQSRSQRQVNGIDCAYGMGEKLHVHSLRGGFPAPLGAVCKIDRESGPAVLGEVIGFHDEGTLVLPYGDLHGVRRGNRVTLKQSVPLIRTVYVFAPGTGFQRRVGLGLSNFVARGLIMYGIKGSALPRVLPIRLTELTSDGSAT